MVFIDDASAVFHNPANLLDLDGWEASVEPTFVYHSVSYDSTVPGGGSASTTDPWKLLPHAFVGGPVVEDRVAVGMGISVPYGLSIDWGDNQGLERYTFPSFVELKTFNFNPTAAVRLFEGVHLAAGLDVMWSELTLKQHIDWTSQGFPGVPEGGQRAHADGVGVSANAALTWQFLPRHRVAATVRAPMDIEYDGDLRMDSVPFVPGGRMEFPFASEIRFPTIVGFGYGFQVTDTLRLEANAEWLQFSRFESLPLDTPAPLPTRRVDQDWRDTFTAGLGGSWLVGGGWRLRSSYQFFQTPVPEDTFSASIPDSDQHAVSVGVGYSAGRHRFEGAYSRVFYVDREIAVGGLADGEWEFDVHLISVAYGFCF